MGRHENMPSPVPAQIRDYKMFDVEIKYGLLQVRKFRVNFYDKRLKGVGSFNSNSVHIMPVLPQAAELSIYFCERKSLALRLLVLPY